ncbi:hypothetical protein BJ944DRAFT_266760 [Cunninghamella echinulata]|nr:hypothetical protein BJ944DRAFT_266760 [Cunninghamella echinulata]
MNEQNDLSKLLSQVSLGTSVEGLSTQLEKTFISSTNSIPTSASFSPSSSSPPSYIPTNNNDNNEKNDNTLRDYLQPISQCEQQQQQWNDSINNEQRQQEDGWGDAPSYTSILPYVEFGFTSNMMLNQTTVVKMSNMTEESSVKLDPNQPFNRFQNAPVSFTSNFR